MTRLMVIEDTACTRELLEDVFADRGWEVRGFGTLREAEQALSADLPDLLLSDVHLPDGDAVDLVRRLREQAVSIPVVLISGDGGEEAIQRGFDAGADDFLTKPVAVAELVTKCMRHTARVRVPTGGTEPPLPGHQAQAAFGRYRIRGELGHGAQAVVYEAEDMERGGRVALKVLSAVAGLHPLHRGRFLKEAYALSAVSHPSVARLRDFGCAEGRLFCAIELIEGPTLRALRERDVPTLSDCLSTLLGVAEGIRAAHAAGIVHRDVKPDNVILRHAQWERPVLIDFGLAKQVCDRTATAGLTGTPGYVPPELILGEAASNRSDLWSLGALAWYLLEGSDPFPGLEGLPLLQATTREPLPSPRCASPELAALVRRLTEIDPARRPAGAEEVVQELRRLRERATA